MPTISFRRLSDATLAKYEAAEREGTLTPRQRRALEGHRALEGYGRRMRAVDTVTTLDDLPLNMQDVLLAAKKHHQVVTDAKYADESPDQVHGRAPIKACVDAGWMGPWGFGWLLTEEGHALVDDYLQRKQNEIARLREALQPFADLWPMYKDREHLRDDTVWYANDSGEVTFGDLRRAFEVLAGEGKS